MKTSIGIDIGGTNTRIAQVDAQGTILKQTQFPTHETHSFEAYVAKVASVLQHEFNLSEVEGIGIGAPAGNRFTGTLEAPANVAWKGSFPIAQMLSDAVQLRVVVDNDANTAAIGEQLFGCAKGLSDFIHITLGTGLGSGIVINHQLHYGSRGFAGELGHISMVPDGRQCGCGKKGCLETYVSASGLVRTCCELMAQETTPSALRAHKTTEIDAALIFQYAEAGDVLAAQIFEKTGQILGTALANYTAITEPQAYILGGGLAKAGMRLLEPARKAFHENLLFLYAHHVDLFLSEIPDQMSGVLGAAAIGLVSRSES